MKLNEIASILACTLEGDGSTEITGVAPIKSARAGEVSFLVNPKYLAELKTTSASALIVGMEFQGEGIPLLRHANPYLAFAKALEIFNSHPPQSPHIDPTVRIASTASIGEKVYIGPYSVVGEKAVVADRVRIGSRCLISWDAVIGEETLVHSGCVIRERVRIGRRCIIQDNAVIGADGFGYARQDDRSWYKIVQTGTVIIEDDVEIGACTTIDRATIGETRIGAGTKIDNLVHIGHGCQIGRHCLICAQVGLAGTTTLGDYVILAGQVGAAGHLTIGSGVIATAQTGIPGSVDEGKHISGAPAMDHRDWLKSSAMMHRLPDLKKAVRDLEKRIRDLEEKPLV
jgi:UDP-3-O-[3-hydroxymyristoyl] glucosamine N-acyltransferase